jgi:hypothetical protein
MKRILIFVFILGSSLVSADGQVAGSTPVPAVAERNKLIYDDLTNDNRKNVIIAFRVVKLPDAEKDSVTLLWKELQSKETAKIAVEEK